MGAGTSAPAAEMSSAVAATINRRIAQSKVVIYSKTSCPYCHMAKKVIICNYGQGIRRSWNWKNPTDIENKVRGSTPGPNKPLLLRS